MVLMEGNNGELCRGWMRGPELFKACNEGLAIAFAFEEIQWDDTLPHPTNSMLSHHDF